MMESLNHHDLIAAYCAAFRRVKRANGKAPHKPVMLLTILDMVRKNEITTPYVMPSDRLAYNFKLNWEALVNDWKSPENFTLPFYHLQNDKGPLNVSFWTLQAVPGQNKTLASKSSIKTFRSLRSVVACAKISEDLFALMLDPKSNEILRGCILEAFFPYESKGVYEQRLTSYKEKVAERYLNESEDDYQEAMVRRRKQLTEEQLSMEQIERSEYFKQQIPKSYQYTCAVSKMRVDGNARMIDACHIHPLAISRNDHIKNGIALTPTIHRAFDGGLLAITDDFTVMISTQLQENTESAYHLRQFEGNALLLPSDDREWPSLRHINWHRQYVFRR